MTNPTLPPNNWTFWQGSSSWIYRRRGFLLRALLCWAVGWLALSTDEGSGFDTRFQIRGPQEASDRIVLINLRPQDFQGRQNGKSRLTHAASEMDELTDNFYWDHEIWQQLLSSLLAKNVDKIGVTFFFRESLGPVTDHSEIFQNSKVVWSYTQSPQDRSQFPLLTNGSRNNIASNELQRDEDGVVRRFTKSALEDLHLAETLSGVTTPHRGSKYINFRGGANRYKEYSLKEVLSAESELDLSGKIVIIGPGPTSSSQILTPIGILSRGQTLANLVDNQLNDRWIFRAPNFWYALSLLFLSFLCLAIVMQYPQAVAVFLLIWLATFCLALSAWIFDTYNFWIPGFSPVIQIIATWVIFTGFQANRMERQNWRLQKEQKYSQEVEQLKNNFVSLISHDLKTPIAKIQAVVDRMILQHQGQSIENDLLSLRNSSEELNKYIQSILKVLRVESRDFRLHRDICDLNQVIEEAKFQLQPLAEDKKISLLLDLEPLFSMEIDHTLIKEVLINLIENAIKYTPPNGTVSIKSKELQNEIWVEIEDSGSGIPKEELQDVWGKFVRGRDQDLKTKGTGLGLYLVKYFIELHGGKVELRSELKKGTKVSFSLPLENSNQELGA